MEDLKPRFIAGIDPSLTSTGIAVLDCDNHTTQLHTVTSTGKDTDTYPMRLNRLRGVATRIVERIPYQSLVLIEGPSFGSKGGKQHDRSGLWWMVADLLEQQECPWVVVTPSQRMTYATGSGQANKDTVLAAAIKRYLDIDITGNDTADAVVLMAMGARMAGAPIEDSLPVTHLRAMNKVPAPQNLLLRVGPIAA